LENEKGGRPHVSDILSHWIMNIFLVSIERVAKELPQNTTATETEFCTKL
jgi:hypothetical protein